MIFYLMDLRPPQSTRTAPLFPSTTLLRSCRPATARWSTARRGFHRVPSDNLLQGIQELERFEGLGPLPVPIAGSGKAAREIDPVDQRAGEHRALDRPQPAPDDVADLVRLARRRGIRSEEHTSELQSLMRISYAVFCLKKQKRKTIKPK